MWNVMGQADTDYEKYLKASQEGAEDGNVQKASGYVQPYADSPLDGEPVGENVYLNLIKTAKKRLYVATPYLIISDEMTRELGLAAKRGVDVRVFTPGIPDKKIIYGVTRSYYSGLVRQGVRVYEYTPGFCMRSRCCVMGIRRPSVLSIWITGAFIIILKTVCGCTAVMPSGILRRILISCYRIVRKSPINTGMEGKIWQ